MSFQPGDRVRAKAGGPVMLVEEIRSDGLLCGWPIGTLIERRVYRPEDLEDAEPAEFLE